MIRRACFSDIDGTLSFHDLPGHVRLEDRQAIAAFRQSGGVYLAFAAAVRYAA